MSPRRKAYAYITKGNQLLIFRQPQYPEAGIQVPAGTIRVGESPSEAVLREAQEETGLAGLKFAGLLGERQSEFEFEGRVVKEHAFFFHLVCEQETPDSWHHGETDPSAISAGFTGVIHFDFRWASLPHGLPKLIHNHGLFVDKLIGRMGLNER